MNVESRRIIPESNSPTKELKEKDIPEYVYLKCPTELYAECGEMGIDPKLAAMDAIKIGTLADRGFVYQHIGNNESFRLNVRDFPPYPFVPGNRSGLFDISSSTIKFLSQGSRLIAENKSRDVTTTVQDWFMRTLTFKKRFLESAETRELLSINVGENSFDVTSSGLDGAWKAAGLPEYKTPDTDNPVLIINPKNPSLLSRLR